MIRSAKKQIITTEAAIKGYAMAAGTVSRLLRKNLVVS
jgi:hypothetical protein